MAVLPSTRLEPSSRNHGSIFFSKQSAEFRFLYLDYRFPAVLEHHFLYFWLCLVYWKGKENRCTEHVCHHIVGKLGYHISIYCVSESLKIT